MSLVYQPCAPAVPMVTDSDTAGGVLSSLMFKAVAFVVRPASLVQLPYTGVPMVSLLTTWSVLQETGPLILSVPLACTVTSLVYQPLSPRVPEVTASVAVGPVLSSLMVIGTALAVSPASLLHDPLNSCPVVSAVCD